MIPRPARYLLRFDGLCPTMSRPNWDRFHAILDEFDIRPILSVIPDNRDHRLSIETPDPDFWGRMRSMEAAGSVIALHGYRHICDRSNRGLIPLHRRTEFAGVSESTQQEWIRRGMQILRNHGLNPRLWVAPRHGFDRSTLRALQREGISYLSDGFARVPFMLEGITWIPQQLWKPVDKSCGIWTICIHSNIAGDWLVDRLRTFLQDHASQFTSFDRLVEDYRPGPLRPTEWIYAAVSMWTTVAARRQRRLVRGGR
jgi:peptidoglycan/xylan/chitin deacetylase (PgdA/CDA1 family)